jgi:hypothetical protein
MLSNNNNNKYNNYNNIYATPTEQSRLLNNNNNNNNNNHINTYATDDIYDIEDNDEYVLPSTAATTTKSNIKHSSIYYSLTSLIKRTINDDLITLETKKLYFIITITILLWLLSFLLIIYNVINKIKVDNNYYNVYLFIPMWLGTIISIIKIITMIYSICSNPTLIPRERSTRLLNIMKYKDNNNTAINYNDNDNYEENMEELRYIDYDSLPLMRRLFCSSFLLLLSLILIMITQILFSLWYLFYNDHIINIYHTFIPIIILFSLFLLYSSLIKAASLQTCIVFTVLFIQLVRFVLNCELIFKWLMVTMNE